MDGIKKGDNGLNINDYTYDIHKIESNLTTRDLRLKMKEFVSLVNSDFTKEELLESVIRLLSDLPKIYTEDDVAEAFEDGKHNGYREGYEEAKFEYRCD